MDAPFSTPVTPARMLAKLVSFDTTSRLSNMELIGFVEQLLNAHDVPYVVLPNEDGTKANLYATIGPQGPGGIVLSGHTDVVPVDGQDWSSDPFAMEERGTRYYGRGVTDMKGFIACALALLPEMAQRTLSKPIHFAFSYDEEIGCIGVRPMISHIAEHMPKPDLVIVGEPTSMEVVNAHKTIRSFVVTVKGLEYHSSQTDKGVNAIVHAAELITFLNGIAEEMRERGDPSGRFEPPYSTLSVGLVKGGTAANIIPGQCRFVFEHRTLPTQDADEISDRLRAYIDNDVLPRMRAVHPGADITVEMRAAAPGLKATEAGSPGEALVMMLAGTNELKAVSYATEAGLFQEIEIPTVVCGPGNILQAHKPDEWLEISQLDACEAFMRRLIDYLTAK